MQNLEKLLKVFQWIATFWFVYAIVYFLLSKGSQCINLI